MPTLKNKTLIERTGGLVNENIRQGLESKRKSKSIFWKEALSLKDKLKKSIENKYYWESLLLEDYKTICFFIPKTASSSFREAFYKITKNKKPEKFEDVYTLPRVLKKNLQKYKNYFKFTIMRDPYEKLISCYYDFIIDKRRERVIREYPFYYGMPFEKFVKIACSLPDKKTDVHLKSQHTFITDKKGKLIVNYIAKFENLEREQKKIMEIMKIKNMPKLSHIKKSKEKAKKGKELYNKELKELVYRRYRKDFRIYENLSEDASDLSKVI